VNVLISIPFTGYVPPLAAYSLIPMACKARLDGIQASIFPIGMSLIYLAREEAAQKSLDYDYLLFIDSDMVVPMDLLTRLLAADKDIVTALAFKRTKPFLPCIFKTLGVKEGDLYLDYPKGLIEIAGCGMACCLIKKEVFEKVPKPWFMPTPELGEDLAFCKRATDAGFKIYCDTTLICGHYSNDIITEEHYLKGEGK
jgi:GT2 family glycosyltransferase